MYRQKNIINLLNLLYLILSEINLDAFEAELKKLFSQLSWTIIKVHFFI